MRRPTLLTFLIVLGLVAGVALGQWIFAAGHAVGDGWKIAGEIVLIRPLMLLIMPLVLVSVVVGVTSIGDPSRLGAIGAATLVYFISTMLAAVVLGAMLVTWIAPGAGLTEGELGALVERGTQEFQSAGVLRERMDQAKDLGLGGAWLSIVRQFVPSNLFAELAAGKPLGVIVFGILLGLGLALGGERTLAATRFFEGLFDGLMRVVGWIVWLSPLGVFLLMTDAVGRVGLPGLAGPIGTYMLVVMAGLAIHGFLVLPLVLWLFSRGNPWDFMYRMRRALFTAFGTSSSSATMPVTLETAVTEGGCSRRAANFVIPLGTTVNMDGTALYEAVAVVFLFQLFGIDLSWADLLIVVVTATFAAIGAAGIPSAGLVTMVIVIAAVNTSLTGRGVPALPLSAIGIVLGVDRILDMCRTTVNVWGDMVGAKVITRLAPD